AVAPEPLGAADVGDVQVDVADLGSAGDGAIGCAGGRKLAHHALEVERQRRHSYRVAVVRPFLAGPVAVDLDPYAVGIIEVEGLADQVVGGAGQAPATLRQALQRPGELRPRWHEDREVEEPGRTRGTGRGLGLAPQDEE